METTASPSQTHFSFGVEKVDIFDFLDPQEYLCAVLQSKKSRNPRFSLRAWSRQLGFRNPSYLSAVLRKQRRLQPPLAASIAQNLRLNELERKRFELLVLRENARGPARQELYDKLLGQMGTGRQPSRVDLDRFQLIADWYHLVLLEMVELPDFCPNPEYLSRRLCGLVMPQLIGPALKRLMRLKLIRKKEDGSFERIKNRVTVGDELPNLKVQQHHHQFLERAARALQETPPESRDFRGSTFVFDEAQVPKARKIIREAHQALRTLSSGTQPDSVFRFNSQLFNLTEKVDK